MVQIGAYMEFEFRRFDEPSSGKNEKRIVCWFYWHSKSFAIVCGVKCKVERMKNRSGFFGALC